MVSRELEVVATATSVLLQQSQSRRVLGLQRLQTLVGLRNGEGGQFEVHAPAVLDLRVIQERGDKVKMIDHPL